MRLKIICVFIFFTSTLLSVDHIILFGPPGSGKGTFSQKLLEKGFHIQISPGDILRREIALNTPFGMSIKEIVAKGDYVDEKIVQNIIIEHLEKCLEKQKYFILDGFPRSEDSLNFLISFFKEKDLIGNIKVIQLTIDDETALERITSRRVCPQCDKVYNLIFKPSIDHLNCDTCSIPLIQRFNDTHEIICKRQKYYRSHINPIYYKAKKLIDELN